MRVPHTGTVLWVEALELPVVSPWAVWMDPEFQVGDLVSFDGAWDVCGRDLGRWISCGVPEFDLLYCEECRTHGSRDESSTCIRDVPPIHGSAFDGRSRIRWIDSQARCCQRFQSF